MLIRRSLMPRMFSPSDLLAEMQRLMRPLEETFSESLAPKAKPRTENVVELWLPRAEIHQTDDSLEISIEVPGVDKKDLQVEATAEGLRVRGERKVKDESCPEEGVCASEFVYGAFERYMDWPLPVKHEEAKAKMENGILTITVPLAEEAKQPEAVKVDVE
ncbi:MAG: Hsp20/alpha crystallin family protein [Armatimonadetes bacterium]|nr:Hsp20/alpha crystallin family protein [Armatimonadota bacterium]